MISPIGNIRRGGDDDRFQRGSDRWEHHFDMRAMVGDEVRIFAENRVIDQDEDVLDFLGPRRRAKVAAKQFFRKLLRACCMRRG
jgi:hypothetical protein